MAHVISSLATSAGILLAVTGLYLASVNDMGATVQMAQLLHIVVGWIAILPILVGLRHHQKLRGNNMSGLSAGAVIAIILGSGLGVSVVGLSGMPANPWLLAIHSWSSLAGIVFLLFHIGLALRIRTGARWQKRYAAPAVVASLAIAILVMGVGTWLEGVTAAPANPDYKNVYEGKKFKPANVKLTTGEFVHPSQLSGSAQCKTCHAEIYQQWSESMHRYAATDPHVKIGIQWFQRDNGVAAGRFCAGCHNPIGLLAGEYDASKTPTGTATPAHDEGISCLICHATVGVSDDPLGNGSYTIAPPDQPLTNWPALSNFFVRMDLEKHKAAMMKRPLFQTSKFCASCHQQYIPEVMNGPGPSEPLNQYPEWLESSYADASSPNSATCNTCHMPLVAANDPAAVNGKVHSHRFIGANHAHAVAAGHPIQAELTLEMLKRAVSMEIKLAPRQERQGHLAIEVVVKNTGAGHRFPSGTTDISETWLEVQVGASHKPLLVSGMLDKEHYLDPKAHVWRTVYTDHANVPVDLHDLSLVDDTTVDRFILPGASDTAKYSVPLRGQSRGKIPVRVKLKMRKANQRWNDWLSNFSGTTVPVTTILEQRLVIDLATVMWANQTSSATPEETQEGTENEAPSGMVHIPAGPAILGSDNGDADEGPIHEVEVKSFYIDRFPVTNAQYRRFLRATDRKGPFHKLEWAAEYNWTGLDYPPGTGDRPAVLISRSEAIAYCQWKNRTLPSEAQWAKAARGPKGLKYPWGDRWENGTCESADGMDIPARIGLCPNRASPYGVQEMVGGVFEWTQDIYLAYPRTELHRNANEWITTFGDPSYVVRGVPAGQLGPATTASARAGHADNMRARIGFRCVMESKKP